MPGKDTFDPMVINMVIYIENIQLLEEGG